MALLAPRGTANIVGSAKAALDVLCYAMKAGRWRMPSMNRAQCGRVYVNGQATGRDPLMVKEQAGLAR